MRTHIFVGSVATIVLLGALLVGPLTSDNDIIQEVFEGAYAENNLPGPYMIKYCFDEPTSHRIVVFITEILERAAKGSVADLLKIIQLIKEFGGAIGESTLDCLGRNQEIYRLAFKYDIDASTDFQALDAHIAEYVALHYLETHRWVVDLNDKWKATKYYDFGFAGAIYGHKLVQ
jgi:hypothetical protein